MISTCKSFHAQKSQNQWTQQGRSSCQPKWLGWCLILLILYHLFYYQLPWTIAIDPFWCEGRNAGNFRWFAIVHREWHSVRSRAGSWSRSKARRRGRRLRSSLGLSQPEDGNKGKEGNSHHLDSVRSFGFRTVESILNWSCQGTC